MRETIALIGNPNTGKTSLFNSLTGLRQKVGNYPGITVDRKKGSFQSTSGYAADVIDLPGTYSIHASSKDEEVVLASLFDESNRDYPDKIVVVADATQLKRNLFLFHQVADLGLPTLLVLNMADDLERKKIDIDLSRMSELYGIDVVLVSTRKGIGMEALLEKLEKPFSIPSKVKFEVPQKYKSSVDNLIQDSNRSEYESWVLLAQDATPSFVQDKTAVDEARKSLGVASNRLRIDESVQRYQAINEILGQVIRTEDSTATSRTEKLDGILTHKVWGTGIFLGLLLLMFQAIYSWSAYPMDLIDEGFAWLSEFVTSILPEGPIQSLITEGVIPGIGGVVIFIPQIVILFGFLSVLEESGYMARVVFLVDKLLHKVGLSGKSVVPLMSGIACAIPAVMAARNIENWKERLITILVTPFMTCSARIPVYTILIAVVIPEQKVFGFMELQGVILMGLYLLGVVAALVSSLVLHRFIKSDRKSYFILELPSYKWPVFSNIGINIVEKSKAFVFNAGKIILAVSIVLWFLASYGWGDIEQEAIAKVDAQIEQGLISDSDREQAVSSVKLEQSFLGGLGKAIEPTIRPLGYDWKIGIALISSIAAREVFVGTLATIYSVADPDNELTVKERLLNEKDPDTGKPMYTLALGISLLLFYAFAMQCISTIAIVKRETNGWKWPAIQFFSMTLIAYVASFIAYQTLT